MKLFSNAIAAATLLAVAATAAQACNVNYRQFNQQHRIYKGAVGYDLTFREFRRLETQQTKVRRLEHIFRASGGISPWECAVLNSALNMESARIYVKRHN